MPPRRLQRAEIVATATALADAEGLEAVTLARVAALLGVRSPSLYHHVDGLEGLRRAVALDALATLEPVLREAATGRAGAAALTAMAAAYRDFAHAHPGAYAAVSAAPVHGDPGLAAGSAAVIAVVTGALRAWELDEDEAVHAVRAFRATVHGFVSLEATGGFGMPQDVDTSFARLIAALADGLDRRAARGR